MTTEQAASVVLFYFVGIALGRFLSGVIADKLRSWKIIMIAESVLGVAVLLLAMTRESYAVVVAFLLLAIKGCLLFKYAKIGG